MTNKGRIESPKIVPILVVSYIWFVMWKPLVPLIPIIELRWFMLAGISGAIFLLQGNRIIINQAAKMLLIILVPIIIGGLLGIFRSPQHQGQIIYNTVGATAGLGSYYLLTQILMYARARKFVLIALLFAGFFWGLEIVSRTITLGAQARYTFSGWGPDGGDKNALSLLFALCTVIFLTFFLFWEKSKTMSDFHYRIGRIIFFGATVVCIFVSSLIYSRSGMLTTFSGISMILAIFFIKRRHSRMRIVITVIASVAIFITSFLDIYLEVFPYWNIAVERVIGEQSYDFNRGRYDTINKSSQIIIENPFIGIGSGIYKTTYIDVESRHGKGTTAHNTYLSIMAESGIIGLVALIIWISSYFRLLLRQYEAFNLVDRALMHSFIPFFAMMMFLDIIGSLYFLAALFSTIYYIYSSNQSNKFPQLSA